MRKSVTPGVLRYLTEHRGQNVPIDDVANATGLERAQIQTAIARLARDNGLAITTVVRGNLFRYEYELKQTEPAPDSESVGQTYISIGVTRNDEIIVRDENGTLYKLADL